jgi:hypothetical protein
LIPSGPERWWPEQESVRSLVGCRPKLPSSVDACRPRTSFQRPWRYSNRRLLTWKRSKHEIACKPTKRRSHSILAPNFLRHASRQIGAAGSTGSSFVGLPRDGTTGTDRDGLRRLWLGGGDRAARPDSTRLSSVPVPGLRQTVQRALSSLSWCSGGCVTS